MALAIARPPAWKNPYATLTADRDQQDRGTCVGQSTAYSYDILYMMLTHKLPTDEDKAKYQANVTDSLGTIHDVLYPQSASAECFYQKSREIGGITGEGSETRYAGKAWVKYGTNTENQWHTAKTPYNVWTNFPRITSDGGLSVDSAATFAALHKAEGWAVIGDEYGNATWDEVCDAIFKNGFVISGIPVYENYEGMRGGNGDFPNPKGSIVGYHALCCYGYDENNIYLIHSWGDYCGKYGSLSKEYFRETVSESVYILILDSSDTAIGQAAYSSLEVTTKDKGVPISGTIYLNGVLLGKSPQKFAVELGKRYSLEGRCVGYKPLKKTWTMTAKKKKSLSLSLSLKRG